MTKFSKKKPLSSPTVDPDAASTPKDSAAPKRKPPFGVTVAKPADAKG